MLAFNESFHYINNICFNLNNNSLKSRQSKVIVTYIKHDFLKFFYFTSRKFDLNQVKLILCYLQDDESLP